MKQDYVDPVPGQNVYSTMLLVLQVICAIDCTKSGVPIWHEPSRRPPCGKREQMLPSPHNDCSALFVDCQDVVCTRLHGRVGHTCVMVLMSSQTIQGHVTEVLAV